MPYPSTYISSHVQSYCCTQEAALTRLHYRRCGYDSIQWAAVESLENRIWNPEQNLRYPFVSEELWIKHLSSKRHPEMATKHKPNKTEPAKSACGGAIDACVRLACAHATTLDDDAVLDNLVSATQDAALIESFSPGDPRYKVFSPLHVGDVTQRKFNKKSSS